MRVVLAGGGTGGHIYPALALAEGLHDRFGADVEVHFIGSRRGLEYELVPRAGIPFHAIHAGGLMKSGLFVKIQGFTRSLRGLVEAWWILRQLAPDVVVGTGGYVSGPVGLAASWLGIPLVIQEQNVWPGLTNRLLARRSAVVLVPFVEAVRHLPEGSRVRVTGNPVRPGLLAMQKDRARADLDLDPVWTVLLVTGGSQGAPAINRLMAEIWPIIAERADVAVIWATGPRHFSGVMDGLNPGPDQRRLRVVDYLYDIDKAYAAADLLIGRAGAMTCTELTACGIPAILVPSPYVAEDHQQKNAQYLVDKGAALMLTENSVDREGKNAVMRLIDDAGSRSRMRAAALALFKADAMERIVETVVAAASR